MNGGPSIRSAVDTVQKMHNAYWTDEQIELAARVSTRLMELTARSAAGDDVSADMAVVQATASTIAQGEARIVGSVINGAITLFLGNVIRTAIFA